MLRFLLAEEERMTLKRREDESFKEYKERQKGENKTLKRYLKGRLVWNSSDWGTYKRK